MIYFKIYYLARRYNEFIFTYAFTSSSLWGKLGFEKLLKKHTKCID